MTRPNILLIITDQQRADHLGCYGNRAVRTPNVDALAARGVRFEKFYVSSPICMPNRSTLMTGRMPSSHGVRCNGIPLTLEQRTFVEALREDGYTTALLGKSHLQNMVDFPPLDGPRAGRADGGGVYDARDVGTDGLPYEQESPKRWRDPGFQIATPYYGFEQVEPAMRHGDRVEGEYVRWLRAKGGDPAKLVGPENALPVDRTWRCPQAWRTRVPEELYPTAFVEERTIAYLESYSAGAQDRPFFVQCSFPDPHHPFTPPGKYWDMFDPDAIEAPVTCRPPGDDAPASVRWLHAERSAGRGWTDSVGPFAVDATESREAIALTYGMIAMIDDAVGRIGATLERCGLAENTIVIFTSDHGDFMGDHGLMLKGPLHYQGLVRVPFIWADPRPGSPRGVTRAALTGTIDIAPTLLELAGAPAYTGIQGESLLPAIAGEGATREAMIVEEDGQLPMFGFATAPRIRTVVTPRERLSVYAGVPGGELYDLVDDPLEERNRWDDRVRRADLLELMTQTSLALWDRSPAPTRQA